MKPRAITLAMLSVSLALASVPCEGVAREPLVKPGETPPVGAGITVSYCFRAAAPGRAWDPASTAWSRFNLDVTVTPAD